MTKRRLNPHGKITRNLVTPDQVERRARELALIAGRQPHRRTTSDLREAKRELLGDDAADSPADEANIVPSGMGAPPTESGRQSERQLPSDDQDEERVVREGVDEAGHDVMLQAASRHTRSEG
ncbi:MAG: hypothetical protein KGR98_05365 [Verrucomicrobia bacterium]|nr:hypothetical protein [Verrucomicrobiota bacterium]MDE3098868.1 hypothetical protein [Verrucomicrobiota bacterium]